MEKVSIIIPAYNAEKTLERCIDSIINQSYKNIEIIIINDGSVDNTFSIIKKYSELDNRIIAINQYNRGVSYSRNYGIRISSGDYISFVDADDWIEKSFIERLVSTIKEKNTDFVRCNYYIENSDSRVKAELYDLKNSLIHGKNIANTSIFNNFLYNIQPINNYVMLLLIKSKLVKNRIEFNEELYMMEDVLFYTKLFLNSKKFYFLNEYLYHYDNTSISATRSIDRIEKNVLGILNSISEITQYLNDNQIFFNELLLNYNCINLVINYLEKIPLDSSSTDLKIILKKLCNDDFFMDILKKCDDSYFNTYRKIIVYMLRKKRISIVLFLFKTRKLKKGGVK